MRCKSTKKRSQNVFEDNEGNYEGDWGYSGIIANDATTQGVKNQQNKKRYVPDDPPSPDPYDLPNPLRSQNEELPRKPAAKRQKKTPENRPQPISLRKRSHKSHVLTETASHVSSHNQMSGVQSVQSILVPMFLGQKDIDFLPELSPMDIVILSSLLKRKFGISLQYYYYNPSSDLPFRETLAILNSPNPTNKKKRVEENYKLVFKRTLRHLLNNFRDKIRRKMGKYELEQEFYNYYFREDFEREKLQDYFKITKEQKQSTAGENYLFNPKTINTKYVTTIMKSKLFRMDFLSYLNGEFEREYLISMMSKITKVLQKCYKYLESKKVGKTKMQSYIEENAKCKLPWTIRELKLAKDCVLVLIE